MVRRQELTVNRGIRAAACLTPVVSDVDVQPTLYSMVRRGGLGGWVGGVRGFRLGAVVSDVDVQPTLCSMVRHGGLGSWVGGVCVASGLEQRCRTRTSNLLSALWCVTAGWAVGSVACVRRRLGAVVSDVDV